MKILLSFVLAALTSTAFALPINTIKASALSKNIDSYNFAAYDFEGIVKLSNCSGSLVAFNGQPTSSKAIVMTNGHCIQKPGGYLNPGEVWVNRPIKRKMQIFDSSMSLMTVDATSILYATMTYTDIAFYELKQTYQEIANTAGIRPLLMSATHPQERISIEVISGYWDRGYSCEIDGFVFKMKEGDWTFNDSIRYTETCDIIGGTSGSPVIERGTRNVVGINNTSNESGLNCTLNNPCEVDPQGDITVRKGNGYGQQTYIAYGCLTPDFKFDLSKSGCKLPR